MNFKGFTYLELVIALAVIGILGAIAIPSYINYTRRVYFADIVSAVEPFKKGVVECYRLRKNLTDCSGGQNLVPANLTVAKDHVASITVKEGIITAVPVPIKNIFATDTYIVSPALVNNEIRWVASGESVRKGYAD